MNIILNNIINFTNIKLTYKKNKKNLLNRNEWF